MNLERDTYFELLALRATEGLDGAETRRVAELMKQHPEIEPDSFEQAAAALHLAMLGPERPLPRELEGKLIESGERFVATEIRGERPSDFGERRAFSQMRRGWWAAAAVLAIAVIGWWPRMRPARPVEPIQTAAPAPAVDTLIAEPATLRLPWSSTDDPTSAGASGEVIWNNERQEGFMRFSGLEANDPARFQYQLWIFDGTRDERYPVDGGVFDVVAGGSEVVVPIDAKIRVGQPYMFAVTVEPPGGVVVSNRERIALLAQAS